MSAFPTSGSNTLRDHRNNLRIEIARLEGIVAQAKDWVEALERDRIPLAPADDAAYDSACTSTASTLLTQIRAETSKSSTVGLHLRIKNTLGLQGKDETTS